jgi:hypothetical protein
MRKQFLLSCLLVIATSVATILGGCEWATATPVTLTNATATVTQSGFPITNTYVADGTNGWATNSAPAVAVYEAATPITWANNLYTFQLISNSPHGNHVLGKFRLSYTTDVGPLSPGSNWTQFTPTLASAISSNPVSVSVGNIIEATDVNANFDTITVTAEVLSFTPIRGFRLEAIQNGSGAYPGPGIPGNNNFVLDAFLIDIQQLEVPPAPEPSTAVLLGMGMVGCLKRRRRRTSTDLS